MVGAEQSAVHAKEMALEVFELVGGSDEGLVVRNKMRQCDVFGGFAVEAGESLGQPLVAKAFHFLRRQVDRTVPGVTARLNEADKVRL